jgi:hypothetical protein
MKRTMVLAALALLLASGLGAALLALISGVFGQANPCAGSAGGIGGTGRPGGTGAIVLGPAGTGQLVGATEYGGPGDPSSSVTGSSGANLLALPDSYAELGGTTFQTATAMGGLPYMTPLRITWGSHSAIAYKRDFGFGGGPVVGLPRVIDLWWQFAVRIGIPYENGMWSGGVRVQRPPDTGAAAVASGVGRPAAARVAALRPKPALRTPRRVTPCGLSL